MDLGGVADLFLAITCSYLYAGNVSTSPASLKSQVTPLKVFVKSKKLVRFHHEAFYNK